MHLLEAERLRRHPNAPVVRHTPVAQVLVVSREAGGLPVFLGQWDERAGQFQIIGGRQKQNRDWTEPIEVTAVRELEEELDGQVAFAAGDFRLEYLASFDGETRISPSFGALTAYGRLFSCKGGGNLKHRTQLAETKDRVFPSLGASPSWSLPLVSISLPRV